MLLPPDSPDFNPIEDAFSKLKAMLQGRAERTIDALRAGARIPASSQLVIESGLKDDFEEGSYAHAISQARGRSMKSATKNCIKSQSPPRSLQSWSAALLIKFPYQQDDGQDNETEGERARICPSWRNSPRRV